MSDMSQGPGWWQASDGKWYPPEQAPGGQPGPAGQAGYGTPPAAGGYGAPAGAGFPAGSLASWGQRVGAYLVDLAILVALFLVFFVVGLVLGAISDALGILFVFVGYAAMIALGVYYGFLNGAKGQTPGKAIMGLKVISEQNGQVIGGGNGVIRYIVGALISGVTCGFGGLIDHLFPLWDDKNQTLHDKVVKSVVISGVEKRSFGPELFKP